MIYLTLFIEFFKVGLFSFGGGFGMIPLIQDAVIHHNWMSEDAFYNFIGVCESTPGPIAVNMATYVGSTQAGLPGGIVATLGVITPSFFIIILIAAVIKNLTKNTYVQGFLYGIKPVILALILATGINMLLKSTGYVSLSEYDVNIPAIIILCLLAGIYFFIRRKWKQVKSGGEGWPYWIYDQDLFSDQPSDGSAVCVFIRLYVKDWTEMEQLTIFWVPPKDGAGPASIQQIARGMYTGTRRKS